MTVPSTISRVDSLGNGVTVLFPVPFRFLEDGDLRVIRSVIATGAETILTLNSGGADGYTVSGAGNPAGGSVTVVTAPSSLQRISIVRDVEPLQLIDYIPNDPFPAETLERGLDKLTMLIQQLAGGVGLTRVMRLFEGDTDGAGRYNGGGNRIASLSDGINPTDAATVQQVVAAGSGNFLQAGTGAVTRTMQDKVRESLSVKDFGAVGNGIANDTAAIQAAINASVAGEVYFPAGTYLISSSLTISNPIRLKGAGVGLSTIRTNSAAADIITVACGVSIITGVCICDISLDAVSAKTGGYGISVTASSGGTVYELLVRNVWMSDKMFGGFNCQSAFFARLDGVSVVKVGSNGIGFRFRGVNATSQNVNVWMENCTVRSGTAGGTTIGLLIDSYSQGFYITKCTFESNGLNFGVFITNGGGAPRPPENLWFYNVVCDENATRGWNIDDCYTMRATDCWSTSCAGDGVRLNGGRDIEFKGHTAIGNGNYGAVIQSSTAKQVRFLGGLFDANGQAASNTYSGIIVNSNTTDFTIKNIDFFREGTTKTHKADVEILGGTSDRYIVKNNRCRGFLTTAIIDGGSGVNKFVNENIT